MTLTEQYNQYVQEWIKENPAFSASYEPMLEFDEFANKKLEEYKTLMNVQDPDKSFLEIDYTKESIPSKKYYVLTEDVPCWHWSRNEYDTLDWNIMGYNSKEVSPRKVIPEEYIKKIADDYAVEFAEWLLDSWTHPNFIYKEPKELLEIFKKENGL